MSNSESIEVFERAYTDERGRVFGWVVGLRPTHDGWVAWVQKAVQTKDGWEEFGRSQPGRHFNTLAIAKAWAYATSKERAELAKRDRAKRGQA